MKIQMQGETVIVVEWWWDANTYQNSMEPVKSSSYFYYKNLTGSEILRWVEYSLDTQGIIM